MPRGRREDEKTASINENLESPQNVHPMVSSLLGKEFIGRSPTSRFCYDREEMIRLSKVPLSVNRPTFLSEEFDSDDGKFSPYKWLQHQWEMDGIESRPSKKTVDALKMEACLDGDGAVLSPQRRGFSGGCCPPEDKGSSEASANGRKAAGWTGGDKVRWSDDKKGGDEKKKIARGEREGDDWKVSTRNKSWREGDDKTKTDFKLPFQKSSADAKGRSAPISAGTGSWRSAGGDSKDFRPSFGKSKDGTNRRFGVHEERLPEWAEDGPTTMDDMIELKGFEEPGNKRRNKKQQAPTQEKSNKEKDHHKDQEKQQEEPNVEYVSDAIPSALPETDAEFAAILGLLDVKSTDQPAPVVEREEPRNAPVTGSRLSRFFKNRTSEIEAGDTRPGGVPSPLGHPSSGMQFCSAAASEISHVPVPSAQQENSLLAKIFAQSQASSGHGTPPQTAPPVLNRVIPGIPPPVVRGGMSLEELERGISGRPVDRSVEHSRPVKGNPLQDPFEQATLLQKLQRLSRAQEGCESPSQGGSPPPPPAPGGLPPIHPPPQSSRPPHTGPGDLSSGLNGIPPPQLMLMQQFYQAALVQASQACGGVPPPHVVEQIRQLAIRQMLLTQNKAATTALFAQQQQQQARLPQTTSLIPSSVQRHMKASVGHLEEKKDNHHEKAVYAHGHTDDDAASKVAAAAAVQKMTSQAAYQTMMAAMQGGLPMGAWRGQPGPAHPQPQPAHIALLQQQMLLAQAQAQAHQQQLIAQAMRAKQIQMQHQNKFIHQERAPPVPTARDELAAPMQNPLEKLLAAAGVQPTTLQEELAPSDPAPSSSRIPSILSRLPPTARPMCLEDLERQLTESK